MIISVISRYSLVLYLIILRQYYGEKEGICQNISTDRQGIPEAHGGIPRREARYFAICLTLTPNIAIIPEFYTIFVADQAPPREEIQYPY